MFSYTTKRKSRSILVVNSEPDIADLFAEMLLMDVERYIVTTAYRGEDCLLSLENEIPDMVLVDMELSDMDGWELIERIKELDPDIPVVAISGEPPGITDFTRLASISDYLMKPVTIDSLQIAVRDALEVRYLLENYYGNVKNFKNNDKPLKVSGSDYILLLKQIIIDRKRYVLMRQLYPDKKLKTDPETGLFLESFRKKIDRASNKIEAIKNKECLVNIT